MGLCEQCNSDNVIGEQIILCNIQGQMLNHSTKSRNRRTDVGKITKNLKNKFLSSDRQYSDTVMK